MLDRHRIDNWFEGRPGLPSRQHRPVVFAPPEVIASDHGDNGAGPRVEREQGAFDNGSLLKRELRHRACELFDPDLDDIPHSENVALRDLLDLHRFRAARLSAGPREILEHNFSRQALDHDNHAVANDLRDNAFKRIAFLRRPWTERASAPPLGSLVRVDAAFERTTIPLPLVELAKTIFNRHRRSALRRTR